MISSNEIIGPSRVRAFQKFVIARIFRRLQRARNSDQMRAICDELEKLPLESLPDSELRARQHRSIFRDNRVRDVQSGWRRDSQ